jgi:hypothetical protein
VDSDASPNRIEKFNQLVRAIIVLVLVGGMTYGFIVSKVVSTESYLIVVSIALTWWFKSRDEKNGEKLAPSKPEAPPPPAG